MTCLRVVGWADAVQQARNLGAQVGHGDELFEQVLGHHIRVTAVPDVVCAGPVGGTPSAGSASDFECARAYACSIILGLTTLMPTQAHLS